MRRRELSRKLCANGLASKVFRLPVAEYKKIATNSAFQVKKKSAATVSHSPYSFRGFS